MRVLLLLCLAISVAPIQAYSQNVTLSGLIYADYEYLISTPDDEAKDENAFGYRRVYLTVDSKISDKFSTRVRFEANDGSTTSQGNPAPFIKDLYIKWKDAFAKGHSLTFGVSSPPSFTVAEKVWGFRSLEKTILDRNKIVSSRDMGIVARGPITTSGSVKYGVMLSNNESVRAENDKNKRVYGQLEFYPGKVLVATLGSDFATFSGGGQRLNSNLFVGARTDGFTAGVEGYRSSTAFEENISDEVEYGVALFARATISKTVEVVGRVDRVTNNDTDITESFALAGFSIKPDPHVRIIPNIMLTKVENVDSAVSARLTLHADF